MSHRVIGIRGCPVPLVRLIPFGELQRWHVQDGRGSLDRLREPIGWVSVHPMTAMGGLVAACAGYALGRAVS